MVGGSLIAGPVGIDRALYVGFEYDLNRWWFPLQDIKVAYSRTNAFGTEGTGRAFGGEFDVDVVQFFAVRGGLETAYDDRTVSSDYSLGSFSARTFSRDVPVPASPADFLGAGFGAGGGFGYSFTVGGDTKLLFSARQLLGLSP